MAKVLLWLELVEFKSFRKKMLSSLVKEHHAKQLTRKEIQGKFSVSVSRENKNKWIIIWLRVKFFLEEKRKEAIAAASNLTQALVDHLNVG